MTSAHAGDPGTRPCVTTTSTPRSSTPGRDDISSRTRRSALGGIIGPVAFVAAWTAGAFLNDRGLSPVDDAISELARSGSNTHWLMTVGFITFGIGVGTFAVGVRSVVGSRAGAFLGATAASTLAVAALPLGVSSTVDHLHGVAAGIGYLTLAAAPIAAAGHLRRLGHRMMATTGLVVAGISAVALALSLTSAPTGLFQRIGLTVVDAWIVALSALIASGRWSLPESRHP